MARNVIASLAIVLLATAATLACVSDSAPRSAELRSASDSSSMTVKGSRGRQPPKAPVIEQYRDSCGKLESYQRLPTIDGTTVDSNRSSLMPWTVWIYGSGSNDALCVGTIVHPFWVLVPQTCLGNLTESDLTVELPSRGRDDDDDGSGESREGRRGSGSAESQENDDSGEEHNSTTTTTVGVALTDPPAGFTTSVASFVLDTTYDSASGLNNVALLKVSNAFPRDSGKICLPKSDICSSATSVKTGSGYASGWIPDATAPNGGYWSVLQVAAATTATACEASTTPNGQVGDHASAVSVVRTTGNRRSEDDARMVLTLVPNADDGSTYTSVCCIMSFLNANIPTA